MSTIVGKADVIKAFGLQHEMIKVGSRWVAHQSQGMVSWITVQKGQLTFTAH